MFWGLIFIFGVECDTPFEQPLNPHLPQFKLLPPNPKDPEDFLQKLSLRQFNNRDNLQDLLF